MLVLFWCIFWWFGSILSPNYWHFDTILVIKSKLVFFMRFPLFLAFFHDISTFLKTLTTCRAACKMHGFGRVGNDDKMCNSTVNSSLIFRKKNVLKCIENGLKTTVAARIAKETSLLTQISARSAFWDGFWLALGSQSDPRMDQRGIKEATLVTLDARIVSPGPQGAPRSHFQDHLRPILEQF